MVLTVKMDYLEFLSRLMKFLSKLMILVVSTVYLKYLEFLSRLMMLVVSLV